MIIYALRTKNFIYVGATRDFARRKTAHLCRLKSGKHHATMLAEDVLLYGMDAVSIKVLEVCSPSSAIDCENRWIEKFKRMYAGKVANTRPAIKNGSYGIKHSTDFCEGISKRFKGKKGRNLTAEQSAMMRNHRTADSIKRLRQAQRDRRWRVHCLNDGQIFRDVKACAKAFRLCPNTVSEVCRKVRSTTRKGLRFEYIKH